MKASQHFKKGLKTTPTWALPEGLPLTIIIKSKSILKILFHIVKKNKINTRPLYYKTKYDIISLRSSP